VFLHLLFQDLYLQLAWRQGKESRFTRCEFRVIRSWFLVVKFLSKALGGEGVSWVPGWGDSVASFQILLSARGQLPPSPLMCYLLEKLLP